MSVTFNLQQRSSTIITLKLKGYYPILKMDNNAFLSGIIQDYCPSHVSRPGVEHHGQKSHAYVVASLEKVENL